MLIEFGAVMDSDRSRSAVKAFSEQARAAVFESVVY